MKNHTGATTYTLGTHYLIDYRLGKIKLALSTGIITAGQTLEILRHLQRRERLARLEGRHPGPARARLLFNGRNLVMASTPAARCGRPCWPRPTSSTP